MKFEVQKLELPVESRAPVQQSRMDFSGFETVSFPPNNGVGYVYVLCFLRNGHEVPFYVGETASILQRLNDYFWADFQACTDFRVGEAIKHLAEKSIPVVARYRASGASKADRLRDEAAIIRELHAQGLKLLNDYGAYDYRVANAEDERKKIREVLDALLGGCGEKCEK